MEKRFISTAELAKMLGVSTVTVFHRIKKGEIRATKVGKTFVIATEDLPEILGSSLSEEKKQGIEEAVQKTIEEYGETLRKLGEE